MSEPDRDWEAEYAAAVAPPPATGDLTWSLVEQGIRHARHESIPEMDFVRANAHRIVRVPVDRILRKTPKWWETSNVSALLLLDNLGRVTLEHDDRYVAALSHTHPSLLAVDGQPPTARLINDAWRMFELALCGPLWLHAINGWARAGHLDRERVLRTYLETLAGGVSNSVSRNYIEYYRTLEPTLDDIDRDQGILRGMLPSTEIATLKLALEHLRLLNAEKRLEYAPLLASIPDVAAMSAVSVRALLDIARDAATGDADHIEGARRVHANALEHPNRDIRARASSWLKAHGHPAAIEPIPSIASLDEPCAPRTWRSFVPWPDDEVIVRSSVLYEDPSDPLDLEAALVAWARIRDVDELRALGELSSRATSYYLPMQEVLSGFFGWAKHISAPGYRGDFDSYWSHTVHPPLARARLREVARSWQGGPSRRVLLATPETAAGWVGAMTLVERMRANDDVGCDPWPTDLTAALLRLDPNDPERDRAAQLAAAGTSEAWSAIAYALGGEPGVVATPEWWVAAARARSDGPDPLLISLGLDLPGQGMPLDARARITTMPRGSGSPGFGRAYSEIAIESAAPVEPTHIYSSFGEKLELRDQPTVIRSEVRYSTLYLSQEHGELRWVGTFWPRSVEMVASHGFFVLACASLVEATDASFDVIAAIADSPGTIGDLGLACIALGMSNMDKPARAQAAELVAAETGHRVDAALLGRAMATVIDGCKLGRWSETLRDAATISGSSARSVVAILTALLPLLDRSHTGMSTLLEVLDDESRRTGIAPADTTLLEWLDGFAGSSKSAKVAREIRRLAA